jgi:hypothetical protein
LRLQKAAVERPITCALQVVELPNGSVCLAEKARRDESPTIPLIPPVPPGVSLVDPVAPCSFLEEMILNPRKQLDYESFVKYESHGNARSILANSINYTHPTIMCDPDSLAEGEDYDDASCD